MFEHQRPRPNQEASSEPWPSPWLRGTSCSAACSCKVERFCLQMVNVWPEDFGPNQSSRPHRTSPKTGVTFKLCLRPLSPSPPQHFPLTLVITVHANEALQSRTINSDTKKVKLANYFRHVCFIRLHNAGKWNTISSSGTTSWNSSVHHYLKVKIWGSTSSDFILQLSADITMQFSS